MKVGVFINTTKHEANTIANKFSGLLADNQIETKVVNLKEDCKDIDCIAVFGGDGTVLRVVNYAIEYNIPILAFNVGTVGFLTSLESNELDKAVKLLKDGGDVEKRTVIKATINGEKFYALNEVCVQRKTEGTSLNEVIKLSLSINDVLADNYKADGLIISTPTGSTAYSLSAGGSILSPDINAFIATPVCPHSLHSRPIVYNDNDIAKIKVLPSSPKCAIYVDGKYVKTLNVDSEVEISKSKHYVKFFKSNDNFFEKLLKKLDIWSYSK